MMMDTAIQQQTDSNGQTIVTPTERQALIQKLRSKWPLELSTRIENQAYEKSHGIKNNYIKFVQMYFQQVQTALQTRANQQQTMNNNSITFSNLQQSSDQIQHPRFSLVQQPPPPPRMNNPHGNLLTRLREPQKFNPTPMNTPQSPSLTQGYSSLQPRYSIQPSMNLPRQRAPIPANHFPKDNFPQTTTTNNSNDIVHQYIVGNSSPIVNTNNSSTGDQLLQRILLSNIDGGSNKIAIPNRQVPPTVLPQPTRSVSSMNSTNSLQSSQQFPSSPSVVMIPQTSTVQTQPSNNITIQQSPLSNSNGPLSANSQSSTTVLINQSSGMGSILSPDDETVNLIKYLKENLHRLQLLTQKFTNEGNSEKLRQVQSIHQQIIQFITNPTYETLANAKHYREMLDRIPNRVQPTNVFNQCSKATNDFLLRDQKERINVTKRYLEPLTDVINGVPHKMMRLDVDNYSAVKIRSSNHSSLLTDEINQIPPEIFSIECHSISRTRRNLDQDEEYSNKSGFILRCQLMENSHPILPSLRLFIPTNYPEQPPEILSLTKTMPPRLEFTNGHPFFDQISSIFVSHLFKLPSQHTITEILNIWRQAIQTAL